MRYTGRLFSAAAIIIFIMGAAQAQTTQFTYQGILKDGANAANGNYHF